MATIIDVAKASGVSVGTVSNVINDTAVVKPSTRERVLSVMRELQFTPSPVAQAIAGKQLNVLGVSASYRLIFQSDNHYTNELFHGFLSACERNDVDVRIFTKDIWSVENGVVKCGTGHCDGVVLISPQRNTELLSTLIRTKFPFVVASDMLENEEITCVDIDNYAAAKTATKYLIDHGHSRIAVLCLDEHIGCNVTRLRGYKDTLAENGILYNPELIVPRDDSQQLLRSLLKKPAGERPTAILAMADTLVYYQWGVIKDCNLSVPNDISIVGFNDEDKVISLETPLTSIWQPIREIGSKACELLADQAYRNRPPGDKVIFPHKLIERQSVAFVR